MVEVAGVGCCGKLMGIARYVFRWGGWEYWGVVEVSVSRESDCWSKGLTFGPLLY